MDNLLSPQDKKNKKLRDLVASEDARFQAVEELIKAGAVVDREVLASYLKSLISSSGEVEFEQIYKIISLFVEKGVKVNEEIFYDDRFYQGFKVKFLQIAVDAIEEDKENKNAVFAAIALLENNAAFVFENDSYKNSFLKAVAEYRLEYIKTLVEKKFYIKPDYRIDGALIYQGEMTKDVDQIYRKKESILAKPFRLEGAEDAAPELSRNLENNMNRGINTQNDVKFVVARSDGRLKKYMVVERVEFFEDRQPDGSIVEKAKKVNSAPFRRHYGNNILRVLSDKKYAAKEGLICEVDQEDKFVIKWDDNLGGQELRDHKLYKGKDVDENQARLYGVMLVLGEGDCGAGNVFESAKTSRPVRIDSLPFFNDRISDLPRFRGSLQSQMFLKNIAGQYDANDVEVKRRVLVDAINNDNVSEQRLNEIYFSTYNDSINQNLLNAINKKSRESIRQTSDYSVRNKFCAFMKGVQDAIDLSKDTAFLDALEKKYKDECGGFALTEAKICRAAFLENVKECETQFASYLKLYHEMASPKHKAARNFGDKEDSVVVVNEGGAWAEASGASEQATPASSANRGGRPSFLTQLLRLIGCASASKIADDGRS